MAGGDDKVSGKAKEAFGSVTGDESKKNEGKAQNLGGKVQDTASGVGSSISNAAQSAKETITGSK